MKQRIITIDASKLFKGQSITGDHVWEFFVTRKPDKLEEWITQHGDEATAKAARLSQVLLQVRDWLDRERCKAELPPLIMSTTGGCLNILTDEQASTYLNDQAFQGLRRHQRATNRLVNAVDESQLSSIAKREHQNRVNVHSFIAASTQGAQRQLKVLKQAGKKMPRLSD